MIYEEQPEQQLFNDKIILKSRTGMSALIRRLFRRLDTLFLLLMLTLFPISISLIILYILYFLYASQMIGFLIFVVLSVAIIFYTAYFYRRYSFDLIARTYRNLVEKDGHIITKVSKEGISIDMGGSVQRFVWSQIEELCRYVFTRSKQRDEKYKVVIVFNDGDFISVWDNEEWNIYKKILKWSNSRIRKIQEIEEFR